MQSVLPPTRRLAQRLSRPSNVMVIMVILNREINALSTLSRMQICIGLVCVLVEAVHTKNGKRSIVNAAHDTKGRVHASSNIYALMPYRNARTGSWPQ